MWCIYWRQTQDTPLTYISGHELQLAKRVSHPIIAIGIALTPPAVTLGTLSNLSVCATLSSTHPTPITIYTWPTVFNVGFALQRKNFFCEDLSNNNTAINLETRKGGRRPGFVGRKVGSPFDKHFHTLEPGRRVEFTVPFNVPNRERHPLTPGHRYRFGINEGERVDDWLEGTRAELMVAPWEDEPSVVDWRGERIELILPEPIEFEVLEG